MPFFSIFNEILLLAFALIQKSIYIKNRQLNFLNGGVGVVTLNTNKNKIQGTGNQDCLRVADEIDWDILFVILSSMDALIFTTTGDSYLKFYCLHLP